MIVPRGAAVPLALLVAIGTVTITFNLGVGAAPATFFGVGDTVVIGPANGDIPGRGQVATTLVAPLAALPYVRIVSPEVYAITAVDGRSLFVRGVDPAAFLAIEGATVTQGRTPSTASEAMVGAGWVRQFGRHVGDVTFVPSSFDRTGTAFLIVGVFDAPGPARDEFVATIEGARRLTNLPEDQVHLIRVSTSDRANLSSLVNSVAANFTYSDVKLSTTSVLPGEPVTMTANLTNWGIVPGTKVVQVREDGLPVAERPFSVGPRSTIPVELVFFLAKPGVSNISINPTFRVIVKQPVFKFADVPGIVVVDRPFAARVVDLAGAPAQGVRVRLGAQEATTDADGVAELTPRTEGRLKLLAYANDSVNAVFDTLATLAAYENLSVAGVDSISPPPDAIGAAAPSTFTIRFHNRGGIAGVAQVNLTVDGLDVGGATGFVAPEASIERTVTVPPMGAGQHLIGTLPPGPVVGVRAYDGKDPRVEALLEAYQNEKDPAYAPSALHDPTAYVDRLLGNVTAAVIALSVAAGALVMLGAVAVLSRHVAERAPSIGALKALGATDDYILAQTAREAIVWGGIAALVGVGAGVGLGLALDATGIVRAFGHAVHPAQPWNVLALIFIVSIAFIVLAARVLVGAALRRSVDDLLRSRLLRPGQTNAPSLHEVLEGRT